MTLSYPAVGRSGMVATSQPLATLAGINMLQSGGNAVDAAIACNLVLAVTEPHMCGPGGDLFALVWDPVQATLQGINASGRSPKALTLEALNRKLGGASVIPGRGPLSLTAPGAVAGWQRLHERYGRKPWASLFTAAIEIAREGFAVGAITALWWQRAVQDIRQDKSLAATRAQFAKIFTVNGSAPTGGTGFRNPGLARLFECLRDAGRAGFYAGDVARALIAAQSGVGGQLALSDLAAVEAEWVTPLATHYRGCDVHVIPPNSQGLSVLQMLNILAHFPVASMAPDDPAWWHLFLEAKKLVFADRARYYADPAASKVPIAALLDPSYAAARAALIDLNHARADQTPGAVNVPASDTTYLTVADRDGCMVSLIQSLFVPFGSSLVVPEFGFALQSRGSGFALDPHHANCYAPGKRPFHTLMPGFVTRDGAPYFSFGAVGGDMQPQAQVQLLANLLDFGCNVQHAGDLPRIRHVGGANPNGSSDSPLGIAHYETTLPVRVVAELSRRGHQLQRIADPINGFVGGYQGIMRDPVGGAYWGASESRLDGCALGI